MKNYKYLTNCVNCNVTFQHYLENQKTCSKKCRKEYYLPSIKNYKDIPSSTTGSISELIAAIDLMRKGYSVFRALSSACYCDLIAIETKEKKKLEIEVRTGYKSKEGKISFPKKLSQYDNGNITAYAVVERNEGCVYYFNTDGKEIEIEYL